MSGSAVAFAEQAQETIKKLVVQPSDLIIHKDGELWAAIKILAVDPWPDGTAAAHCLSYKLVQTQPTMASLKKAEVMLWHAPIDAASFSSGWQRIGNMHPTQKEMQGFAEYLKLTDFARYASLTGQDVSELLRQAKAHYKRAHALGVQGKRLESIAEYGRAIELYPLFYEAIDNRAFTYMELGQFRLALQGFEQSLSVNPNGVAAFFSKGECLMKLGELKAAAAIFEAGQARFPGQAAMFSKFLERVRSLQKHR